MQKILFMIAVWSLLATTGYAKAQDISGKYLEIDDLVVVVKDYCVCLGDSDIDNAEECNIWSKWKCYKTGYIGRMADYNSKDRKVSVNAVWFYNPRFDCGGRIFQDEMGGAISFGELENGCNGYNGFCPSQHLMKLNKENITKFMVDTWTINHWIDYLERNNRKD